MGAIFHTPLELDVDLDGLQERFPRLACLDMQGMPVQSAAFAAFDCTCSATKPAAFPVSTSRP